jgi:ParB family chromosome partitioning protein
MLNLLHNYRGQIQGVVSQGTQSCFISRHSEKQATALYQLDTSTANTQLNERALPCGASAITANTQHIYVAGTDGLLYQTAWDKTKVPALANLSFTDSPVLGLALLASAQLAVLQARKLSIVNLAQANISHSFALDDLATRLAASTDGLWLALGFNKGKIAVYHAESETSVWELSNEGQVHQGEVAALLFAGQTLQFYSAGADKKLFLTHARGTLQPLDKGKNSNHDATISALLLGQQRLFTGAADKSIKAWPLAGGQPLSFKDGLANVSYLSHITYLDKPALLVACSDDSLRIIGLDADEKFTEVKARVNNGYELAKWRFGQTDPAIREQAIDLLASYDDKRAFDLLANQLKAEQDQKLRNHIVAVAAKAKHAQAKTLLETALKDTRHDSVRQAAFSALVARHNEQDIRPLQLALATDQLDIGKQALKLLAQRAATLPAALQTLTETLNHKQAALRLLALSLLESIYPDSPQASLLALAVPQADLQRAALIRLYQRQWLQDIEVKRALLLAQADTDANLRHTAFLVAILSQPLLTQSLQALEPDLARQLHELESFELVEGTTPKAVKISKVSTKEAQKLLSQLSFDDYSVLLQGMSNTYADISFLAAFALAVLKDQRAFGMLLVLSREANASIRAGVCRAFAWLGQDDSIPTLELLLNDEVAEVRDAAFTALLSLQSDILLSIERGFAAKHQDIHARSLKSLLELYGSKATSQRTQALPLLQAALNDPFDVIRQEAFKTCLNQQLGDTEIGTLRLLQSSRYENLHQEVLNELMAKSRQTPVLDWVQPLLLELFNDNFAQVRLGALSFGLQDKKRFQATAILAAAVGSQYLDIRQTALNFIAEQPSQANQAHLIPLLQDSDSNIRNKAIDLLVDAEQQSALLAALDSPYTDVQVSAATALAKWAEPKAFAVLVSLLSRPEPETKADKTQWTAVNLKALAGLALMADSRAFTLVQSFLSSTDAKLVKAAAQALPWVSDTQQLASLNAYLTDERPAVRANAAFALALFGQSNAKIVLADQNLVNSQLTEHQALTASLLLAPVTPLSLQTYFEQTNSKVAALLALVSHELLLHGDEPELSTWALSLNASDVQLFCANLIMRYGNVAERWEYVRTWLLNQQGLDTRANDETRWAISVEDLQQFATLLVYGSGHLRAYLIELLSKLKAGLSRKEWQLLYGAFTKRHATAIKNAHDKARPAQAPQTQQNLWNQRAFGALLGLIRQGYESGYSSLYWQHLEQRRQALRSLQQLAERDASLKPSVLSSLLTLINDGQQDIRQMAFDNLKALGMDLAVLGQTATTSPQSDIARQGLQLLVEHYPLKQSHSLLQSLLKSNHQILAPEAWKLYSEDIGFAQAAPEGLQSQWLPLREQLVSELETQYAQPVMQTLLVTAAGNDYLKVALKAAQSLAQHQHPQALAVLTALFERNIGEQDKRSILNTMRSLPGEAAAIWLLDYLTHKTVPEELIAVVYLSILSQRPLSLFPALLQRLEQQPREAKELIKTLITITGYDQKIEDYNEERADKTWLQKQYPRQDALLLQLFKQLIRLNYVKQASELAPSLAWVQANEADAVLREALPVLSNELLKPIVEAIAYRAEKRGGSVAGLLQTLSSKEVDLQFIAAEGLAKAGHQQGFSILMAAIDYQTNDDYRKRAVLALGKSGDERALDKLLKLAEDKEHFLHEVAIEAIGNLGKGTDNERIFKQLKARLYQADTYSELQAYALNGLRWLNTSAAWQTIQEFIGKETQWLNHRKHAIKLLQYRDTEASRELLLKVIRQARNSNLAEAAYNTARLLWKAPDTTVTEVDYALLQSYNPTLVDSTLVQRIIDYAPTSKLFELASADYSHLDNTSTFTKFVSDLIISLGQALMQRADYTEADLLSLLRSNKAAVVQLATRLLGRLPSLSSPLIEACTQALESFYARWQNAYQLAELKRQDAQAQLPELAQGVQALIWVLVQHQQFPARILALLHSQAKRERELQLYILTALLSLPQLSDKAVLQALDTLTQADVLQVSTLANQLLAKFGQVDKLQWQRLLAQPEILLADNFKQVLSQAASDSAYQAQVLPLLIAKQDLATLSNIAQDRQYSDSIRLGVIEGLARIVTPAAQAALQHIKAQADDQDIAKAAYRALRRLQRSQAKPKSITTVAGVNA